MENVLLIGNFGNGNVGDDAIFLGLLNELKNPVVFSKNPIFVKENYKTKATIKYPSFESIKIMFKSKKIIICGGDMFSSYAGTYAKFLPLFLTFLSIFGKEVIYRSIGVYRDSSRIMKFFLNISMLFSNQVSFRDKETSETMSYVVKKKKIEVEEDPAISYLTSLALKNNKNRRNIGICLRFVKDKKNNKKIINIFSKLSNRLIEKKYNVFFIPFETGEKIPNADNLLADKIYSKIEKKSSFKILNIKTPIDAYNAISNMSLVFGMTDHLAVFSKTLKVPFIGICYSDKINSVSKKTIELSDLTENKLISVSKNYLN